MEFSQFRAEVYRANVGLAEEGLVTMTSGNASGHHHESGIVLIKPSGVSYNSLRPEDLIAVKLDGMVAEKAEIPDGIQGSLKPSVDTPHHLYLYRHDECLGGIVHTHSKFATVWASLEKPIPCGLTAIADEFGGDIPCAPYVDNCADNIGRAILEHRSRGPAVLLGHHGVFTFSRSPLEALKAAVMLEDVAQVMLMATLAGKLQPLTDAEIAKWWDRYHSTYGQVQS